MACGKKVRLAYLICFFTLNKGFLVDCDLRINVARLNGFLQGVLSLCGNDKRYLGAAFLVQQGEKLVSIEKLIAAAFSPRAKFVFYSKRESSGGLTGLGGLEQEIRQYLISNILGISDDNFSEKIITDRQANISLAIMSLIDPIVKIEQNRSSIKVVELRARSRNGKTLCVFFCVSINDFFLVLQFHKPMW